VGDVAVEAVADVASDTSRFSRRTLRRMNEYLEGRGCKGHTRLVR
jgi:hypothetical protein